MGIDANGTVNLAIPLMSVQCTTMVLIQDVSCHPSLLQFNQRYDSILDSESLYLDGKVNNILSYQQTIKSQTK